MKEFEGKVAIVTGTTGIGRAIAKRFAAGGANVLACGIEDVRKPGTGAGSESGRTESAGGDNAMSPKRMPCRRRCARKRSKNLAGSISS